MSRLAFLTILAAAVLLPPGLFSRPLQTPAPTSTAPKGEDTKQTPEPCQRDTVTVDKSLLCGAVRNAQALPANNAVVAENDKTSDRYLGRTDNHGNYEIDLTSGLYDVTVIYEDQYGHEERQMQTNVVIGAGEMSRVDFYIPKLPMVKTWIRDFGWILAIFLPILFLASILAVRWNNIARSARYTLLARIKAIQPDLGRLSEDLAPVAASLKEQLQQIERELNASEFWDVLFWSRGKEFLALSLIHKAEVLLVEQSSFSDDAIDARLLTLQQELSSLGTPAAARFLDTLKSAISSCKAHSNTASLKQLLIQGLTFLHDSSDTGFAELTSWQNKSFWLTAVGLLLMVGLALFIGHWVIFLAGAAGGFLGRLMRQLKRADVPSDYGASWSTLFLSPVSGGLAGWFGITLIVLLSNDKFGLLAGPLRNIDWSTDSEAPTLAIAFLFGFSERLFEKIVGELETGITKREQSDKPKPELPPPIRPGVVSVQPPSTPAGDSITLTLRAVNPADVQQVILRADNKADIPLQITNQNSAAATVTATVPKGTDSGPYKLSLQMAAARIDSDVVLTVQ